MPNYYHELPEGYKVAKVVDAKEDKKFAFWMNFWAAIIMIVTIVSLFFIKKIDLFASIESEEELIKLLIFLLGYLVIYIIYIIGHELVHGIAYKALTKQKLTFGLTATVAFCGVPNIYTTRKTSLIALLSPFITFTLIFIPLLILMPANIYGFLVIILFAGHFGGCSGDLYCTYLLLFKLPKNTLINDTGPKQTFYVVE
ncbi:MAG: DUF3267 domain-containing protein [Bacilli bacterium]|nr:DUF3267 domain-containing protein [Bacilli bacterium]